jgi:hypothetical protein
MSPAVAPVVSVAVTDVGVPAFESLVPVAERTREAASAGEANAADMQTANKKSPNGPVFVRNKAKKQESPRRTPCMPLRILSKAFLPPNLFPLLLF